jgi:hypothetical protein
LLLALFLLLRAQTSARRKSLSAHNRNSDGYIPPLFTTLAVKQEDSTDFSSALVTFLAQSPEFASSQEHMEFLRYCFMHYVNFDPEFRGLSILEKLARAGKMAKDFLGTISCSD